MVWKSNVYSRSFQDVPDTLETRAMCDKAVDEYPRLLFHIPNNLNTQEMCVKVVKNYHRAIRYVPDHLKTQEICNNAVIRDSQCLEYVPDNFKTKAMCDKVVDCGAMYAIRFIPLNLRCVVKFQFRQMFDWFITQEIIENGGGCSGSCEEGFRSDLKVINNVRLKKTKLEMS